MSIDSNHAAVFARLSAELLATRDESVTVHTLVERSLTLAPEIDHASLTIAERKRARTLAATSIVASQCDALQYELREGPCIEALSDNEWYRSGDIASDPRWPRWGPRAAAQGVGSLLAVRLTVGEVAIGALNLYSERRDGFNESDTLDLVFLYALHAAGSLAAVKEISGLQLAMQHRHTIGVAQGILVQRYGISVERAFDILRRYSSTRNVKLRDIAAYVVEHHHLPDTPVEDEDGLVAEG
jgi:transcriptional regulator with GAF, ATPase, and Fis domain